MTTTLALPPPEIRSPRQLYTGQDLLDLKTYLEMVRYCRPSRSKTERRFIQKYIAPTGALPDDYGNYVLRIGSSPVLWSCHTDTVHSNSGAQDVVIKGDYIELPLKSTSSCLGADCTTGVWIMLEMIKASVPGLYIFHRDEEIGGRGSSFIAKKSKEVLEGIKFAIAFDRYGTTSVITRQASDKCSSQDFVDSIIPMLPGNYIADNGGTFTDTANYTDLVSECTNLSVGYYGQHTRSERQSISHMIALRNAMLVFDATQLEASRDLKDKGTKNYYQSYYPTNTYYEKTAETGHKYPTYRKIIVSSTEEEYDDDKMEISILRLVKYYPDEIADLLEECGFNAWELVQEIRSRKRI